jgi:uncharacterized protein (TIGR00369 family)
MPSHEDGDEHWTTWAAGYPTVCALNLECNEVRATTAEFVLGKPPFPPNPNGAVNGGIIALAVDQIMGVLAARVAPTGSMPVTAVLNVIFHAPAFAPVTLTARAVPGGRSIQTIEVSAHGADGRLSSTSTGTMSVGSPNSRGSRVG